MGIRVFGEVSDVADQFQRLADLEGARVEAWARVGPILVAALGGIAEAFNRPGGDTLQVAAHQPPQGQGSVQIAFAPRPLPFCLLDGAGDDPTSGRRYFRTGAALVFGQTLEGMIFVARHASTLQLGSESAQEGEAPEVVARICPLQFRAADAHRLALEFVKWELKRREIQPTRRPTG